MKCGTLTACLYPTEQPIHMLAASARRFGVPLTSYGVGCQAVDWCDIKVTKFIPALHGLLSDGYTHVLYTDGADSLFVRPWDDILTAYAALSSPMCLMSAERDCYPFRELGGRFRNVGTWRYPCAGQFMGEIAWILERWAWMQKTFESHPERNDQAWITLALLNGEMPGLVLDSGCRIFQSMSGAGEEIRVSGGEVVNVEAGSRPCVVHCNGGYSDPVTGRDERIALWVCA